MLNYIKKFSNRDTSDQNANASVIWLHGLGANGYDFADIIPVLELDDSLRIRFIFPHAPEMPVTVNNHYVMPAWYDIAGIGEAYKDDEEGIKRSSQSLMELVDQQKQQGIASGRIILAGFSQGGAIALYTGTRYQERLAGILALSTYLPLQSVLGKEKSISANSTPVYMMHGEFDPVVPIEFAIKSREILKQEGYSVDWQQYPMDHTVSLQQLRDIGRWFYHRLDDDQVAD